MNAVRWLIVWLVAGVETLALLWGMLTVGLSGFYFFSAMLWSTFGIGQPWDPLVPPTQIVQLAFVYGFPFVIFGIALEFFRRRLSRDLINPADYRQSDYLRRRSKR